MLSDSEELLLARPIILEELKNMFVTHDSIAQRLQGELYIDRQKALNVLERILSNI